MSAHRPDTMAPPGTIAIAVILVVASLLLVIAVRAGVLAPASTPAGLRAAAAIEPESTRLLRFADQEDGTVLIEDAGDGATIARIGREDGGFIRGVMRGLARERRMNGIGAEPPFRLTLWRSGELSLTDTETGRIIELGAFGPDNRAAFVRLLEPGGEA